MRLRRLWYFVVVPALAGVGAFHILLWIYVTLAGVSRCPN